MPNRKHIFEEVDSIIKEVLGATPLTDPLRTAPEIDWELRKKQRKIQDKEAELKARESILQKASLVSETDRKGIITYVNDKFCEISGYTEEELIGQPHNIVRHPDMSPEVFRNLWATIGRGKTWRGIIKNRRKDGSPYWVDATIAPVIGPDGKPMKYIGIRFDITPYVQKIAYYAKLYRECQQKLR